MEGKNLMTSIIHGRSPEELAHLDADCRALFGPRGSGSPNLPAEQIDRLMEEEMKNRKRSRRIARKEAQHGKVPD